MANPERNTAEKKEGRLSLKTLTYAEMAGGGLLMLVSGPVGVAVGLAVFATGALEYQFFVRGKSKNQNQQKPQAA